MNRLSVLVLIVALYNFVRLKAEAPNIKKVTMTQKGYIQFLKYKVDVPPLQQFTFCLWIKSQNLTHSHPIISYSKHERDRYIRSGITDGGNSIKFILMEQIVIDLTINIRINTWYHICQSWDSNTGKWQIYLNGQLRGQGISKKLRGAVIPGGGDVVIGQEYTDFDKGLDDGIEGEIFGFNMILSSTTEEPNHRYYHRYESDGSSHYDKKSTENDGYIRLDSITQEVSTTTTSPKKESKLIPEQMAQSTKINNNKTNLRFVTENYYNLDVDYTTFSPEDFRSVILRNASSDVAYSGDEEYEDDLLRPPYQSTEIPFWSLINKAGREGRFKAGEFQTLALTNLPVYETPPNLPIYDDSKKTTPSFEVLYSKANFKGNQWYDQNDYFPKELLQRPKHGHGSKHHRNNGRKNRHKQSRPNKNKAHKDLYPYPSEHHYEYIKNPSEHSIFKREAREKNVEILNPDSIIIYPGKSGILNVEVHPKNTDEANQERAEISQLENVKLFENYRLEDSHHNVEGETQTVVNIQDEPQTYEAAYAKLHYTGSLLPKKTKNNIPDRNQFNNKQYPHSISDKINEANYEKYLKNRALAQQNGDDQFEKPVKLGNALGELRIFNRNGDDRTRSFVGDDDFTPNIDKYRSDIDNKESIYVFEDVNINNHEAFHNLNRNSVDKHNSRLPKSAGRKLVELSFRKCLLDRGSLLGKDSATLISWTMTPMKLYGGAVLKKALPFCGNF